MSDDRDERYRSKDHDDRELEPEAPRADPLEELARLIGQNELFADPTRDVLAGLPHDLPGLPHDRRQDDRYSEWRADHEPQPVASYDDPQVTSQSIAPGPHGDHRDYAGTRAYAAPDSQTYRNEPHGFAADRLAPAAHYEPAMAAPQAPDADAPDFVAAPGADQFYDDPPRASRLGVMTIVIVAVGLAAVGVASAFAYRAYMNLPSKPSAPPPVIHASAEPTKVAPPPPPKIDTARLGDDRSGDRSQDERVVGREEKPLDPKNLVTATPPSPPPSVFPAVPPPGAASVPARPAPQASANPPSVLTEPKRVRTVAVRPDQPTEQITQPRLTAPTAPPSMPMAMTPPPATATPTPRPPTRATTPPPVRTATAPNTATPDANAPLSLAPTGTTPSTTSRPVRAATPAPARTASTAPTAPKATPAPARAGHYMVQVASQKTEADAQTSFRSIRSKYSSVLGSTEAVIRRADLGDKGVYYRAMVGPYKTRDEAVQVCANLKAAGGSCVIQGN